MLDTQEIVIEEYVPDKHAKSIAEMWNRSYESWGGDNSYRTEQSVLSEHQNSSHLKVFLAVTGGEVIGYCSFSHYREDTGALYIPLLNVRPDYHGRKVGKMLVRRAVEETIQLGWPRLDLYTWPGNVKAVPTYKKSGFFWEKRDETTHLMNFIPSVLQTAAVKPYFEKIDWYNDSTRKIVVQPDGRKEDGFDYFTYEWVKDDLQLTMEYERTGRGLRLIETEDYLISAAIPVQHQLPFGQSYPVVYRAVNKSGRPLSLQITGTGNPQISFELNESCEVTSETVIEGSFFVQPAEEEQNAFRTHPVVEAELLINGLPAVFKLGIEPKYPVKVKLALPDRTLFAGEKLELDVTVENEYSTDTVFALELSSDAVLEFEQPAVQLLVPAKGRKTLSIAAKLLDYGIWHHQADIRKVLDGAESAVLQQNLSLVFPGALAAFGGNMDKEWIISSGKHTAYLNKSTNTITLVSGRKKAISLPYPKAGLPYSNAFSKQTALDVQQYKEHGAMVLEAKYNITGREGLQLTMVIKLQGSGLFSRHFKLHNGLETAQEAELVLMESFQFPLSGAVLPYNGEYMDLSRGAEAGVPDYWTVDKFTENWMFTAHKEHAIGLTWPAGLALIQDSWQHAVEHQLGRIPAGSTVVTEPLRLALGTWSKWQDFRDYALLQGSTQEQKLSQPLTVSLNAGNPFVSGELEARLLEQKNSFLDGEIHAVSLAGSIAERFINVDSEDRLAEISIPLTRSANPEADIISLRLDMDVYELAVPFLIFPVAGQPVLQQKLQVEQAEVLSADNGVLQIQASSDFSAGLFSLKHHGHEWLDSSFPQPVAKSWWNPWIGGLGSFPEDTSPRGLLEEPRAAAFAELRDNKGNLWSGLRVSVTFEHNPKFKGLTLHQYYLLLPGVPVLVSVVQAELNAGAPMYDLKLETSGFYHAAEVLTDSRAYITNSSGDELVYKAGKVQLGVKSHNGLIQYGSKERKERLTVLTQPDLSGTALMANTHAILSYAIEPLQLKDGRSLFGKPQFFILSELKVPEQAYGDLLTIRF
ncbi:GNAT family N-acetyltransferase [Paenibacillus sp. MMS20-IR301]|uniref:GNAT family N-acetyltransferase n=1 Tax=Paenibacillus sp. MMS20-IR301 TaxID=2895946 RepID=UPI0028E9EBFC|nr:GNAT family N-acetyltransferase [Paenibacillus sp. MMS20-IR301]WNS45329.1 GNAT family N-acetyltransferase [Paenibacillus sp. MMS20-IR301]